MLSQIYNDGLSAFRSGYSCQHVLINLSDSWRKAIENKQKCGILLVDLSKAFDCLPHSLIVSKLHTYGVSIEATNLLADYLTNRTQRVKIGNSVSSWNSILKGVPQGSILGPSIFNVFMNDIFCAVRDGLLFNYADDNTTLVMSNSIQGVIDNIKLSSDSMISWCTENQMEANPIKFQALLSGVDETYEISLTDQVMIHTEKSVKLLGIQLDNKLNFTEHVSNIIKKASRQLNCLKRLAHMLDIPSKLLIYKSFILANFNYCPAVWHVCGTSNTKKLEKIQYRALKFVYRDYHSSYETLLAKSNLPTLEVARLRNIALEVYKAYNGLNPSYINQMFTKPTHTYNLRAKNSLTQSHKNSTKGGLHSFQHIGVKIWNSLPNEYRTTTDFSVFKKLIKSWSGIKCKCSFCNTDATNNV